MVNMNRIFLFLFGISLFFFLNCNNRDKSYKSDREAIWFDYQVTGREGDDNLTVMLQYLGGGKDGNGISMDSVMLDGEILPADSTKMNGIFYELHKPALAFARKHNITVTTNNKEYKEEFDFRPIALVTPVADTVRRGELVFILEGLEKEDRVRVLLTDTSFINDGINRVETVTNGRLAISKTELESLANGPVQLEIISEYERRINNGRSEGGRLLISYSLKREFVLKDK